MTQNKSAANELQKTTDSLKAKHRAEMEKLQFELTDEREGSQIQISELEQSLAEKTEEIKQIKTTAQKQEAIWSQKMEFNEV